MNTASTHLPALVAHLAERGLIRSAADVEVLPLAGGVSNDVVAVQGPGFDAVVKQALGRLRVAEEWLADPARLDTEGRALRLAGSVEPHAVPRVLDLSDGYLVIERAPADWVTWKPELLAGRIDPQVAEHLGRLLGIWQRATAGDAQVEREFGDTSAFQQLRVDPFHRVIAARHLDLADTIADTIAGVGAARDCLVHGDYTPKNVLVGPGPADLWIIDWEVAHVGDATFDPAWVIGHLLLKSLRRPGSSAALAEAGRRFLAGLDDELNGVIDHDPVQMIRQTGCLLLARVDGKSPVEYLDEDGRDRARVLGHRLLTSPPATITDSWELLP